MRTARAFGLAFTCWLALGAPTAQAQAEGSRQSASLSFDRQRPGVPSGLSFDIDYVNPEDTDAKPPPVRTIMAVPATGAQINTSVPERCTATDAALVLSGAEACPAESQVGIGYIRIDTGFSGSSRFIETDLVLFNQADQLTFLFTVRGSETRIVSHCPIEGRQITCSAPPLPGTPPDGGAVDVVHERIFEVTKTVGGAERGYITTPGECPRDRAWVNEASFVYADGAAQTVETRSPCSAQGGAGGHCANHWNGSAKDDRHDGTAAGDRLYGFRGDDRLNGGGDADCLHGGRGRDRLIGGAGSDLLRGGSGADVIVAADGERDRIRCGRGRDRIASADTIDRLARC